MKRLIIVQIRIELDNEVSDYAAANMDTDPKDVVLDYLQGTSSRAKSFMSLQIDEKTGDK